MVGSSVAGKPRSFAQLLAAFESMVQELPDSGPAARPAGPEAPRPKVARDTYGIQTRLKNQTHRVFDGATDGELKSAKASSLDKTIASIQARYDADLQSGGGQLTSAQQQQLQADLDRSNSAIFLARQQAQVNADKARGKLTRAQVASLDKQMRSIARDVAGGKDDRGVFLKQFQADLKAPKPRTLEASTDRSKIYYQQPNGWSCGPSSLTMALAAWGLRPANSSTMWDMARRMGAGPGVGTPGNASLIADAARQVGAKASFDPVASPANIRAALEKGHTVVLNGSLGIGGHFVYVGGLNPDGTFKIFDPYRPTVTRMTDSQLNYFANLAGPNPHGFAEIWR